MELKLQLPVLIRDDEALAWHCIGPLGREMASNLLILLTLLEAHSYSSPLCLQQC